MASTSETGHAKIPANLYKINNIAKRNATVYKPGNPKLATAAIDTLYDSANTAVQAVQPLAKAYNGVVVNRQVLFAKLNACAGAAYNSLGSLDGVNPGLYKSAGSLLKKINGSNTRKKVAVPAAGSDEPAKTHSVSQQSFDMRAANFIDFIGILKQVPQYKPEEPELKPAFLTKFWDGLKDCNKEVSDAYSPYALALKQRDTLLYHPETGIVKLSKQLKKYINSVSAISKTDKKEASALLFTAPAKKSLFL